MNAKKAAAMIAIKADPKGLDRDLANAKKTLRAFGSDVKKISGKILGGGAGALKSLGAGFGLGAIFEAKDLVAFEKNLLRLQVSAGKSADWLGRLRSQIHDTSSSTGISREDILGGASVWIERTGDVENAVEMMKLLGKAAQASGSSTADLAQATAALRESGVGVRDMEAALSGIIAQSDKGAVGLKDMAGSLAELLPSMGQFAGGKGIDGLRDLGATYQTIMKGAGDAGSAAAQFKGLMGALGNQQVAKKLAALGIQVFDKAGKMRNFVDLMGELAENRKLTSQNMGDIFGDQQARTAVLTVRDHISELRELRRAGEDVTQVQKRFDTVTASSVTKLEIALNRLKNIAIDRAGKTVEGVMAGVDAMQGKNDWEKNPFSSSMQTRVGFEDALQVGIADKLFGGGEQAVAGLIGDQLGARANLAAAAKSNQPWALAARNTLDYEGQANQIGALQSRDARIRAAYAGLNSSSFGTRTASEAFMRDQGVTAAERAAAVSQISEESMSRFSRQIGQEIVSALKAVNLTVRMDANAVAKSLGNATGSRSGG